MMVQFNKTIDRTFYIVGFVLLIFQFISVNLFAQAPYATPDNMSSGNCVKFDGVNDKITLPQAVSNFGTGDFSVDFWITSPVVPSGHSYILMGNRNDGCNTSSFWEIILGVNNVFLTIKDNPNPTVSVSTNEVDDGNWHHIAVVRTSTQMLAYQNGELISTLNVAASNVNTSGQCVLGRGPCTPYWTGGTSFSGKLDELRVWNKALTPTEIRDNMCLPLTGSESGLLGYWNMNEGTGTTINDLTTNGYDGTLQ